MGNTNLPQSGAVGSDNSRDTRSGSGQLSDKEQQERDHAEKLEGIGPAPSRPKNAPPRIPGQQTDAGIEGGADGDQPSRPPDEALAPDDPYNPRNTTGAGDPPGLRRHVHTGHSAPDAT